jgi:hypothetical protein
MTLLTVSSFTMGVATLLPRLPGGDKDMFDFSKLKKTHNIEEDVWAGSSEETSRGA